jgi:hypothetical protein
MNQTNIFLTTFGSGSNQISSSTSSNFSFSTNFIQGLSSPIQDGYVAFFNVIDGWSEWHNGSIDHTLNDTNGYMLVVNGNGNVAPFYNRTIDQLCLGERYEWSAYIANILRPLSYVKPIIQLEVRSTTNPNFIIAQLNTEALDELPTLTWIRFGLSFVTPNRSITLIMRLTAAPGGGNDVVVDDIAFSICSASSSGLCP